MFSLFVAGEEELVVPPWSTAFAQWAVGGVLEELVFPIVLPDGDEPLWVQHEEAVENDLILSCKLVEFEDVIVVISPIRFIPPMDNVRSAAEERTFGNGALIFLRALRRGPIPQRILWDVPHRYEEQLVLGHARYLRPGGEDLFDSFESGPTIEILFLPKAPRVVPKHVFDVHPCRLHVQQGFPQEIRLGRPDCVKFRGNDMLFPDRPCSWRRSDLATP